MWERLTPAAVTRNKALRIVIHRAVTFSEWAANDSVETLTNKRRKGHSVASVKCHQTWLTEAPRLSSVSWVSSRATFSRSERDMCRILLTTRGRFPHPTSGVVYSITGITQIDRTVNMLMLSINWQTEVGVTINCQWIHSSVNVTFLKLPYINRHQLSGCSLDIKTDIRINKHSSPWRKRYNYTMREVVVPNDLNTNDVLNEVFSCAQCPAV